MDGFGITELLLAVIAVVLVLAQTIQYLAKRKENGNGVLGKTVAIYDWGDREKVNGMYSVISAQGWDTKLNLILDILREIQRLESESVTLGREELKAMREHFKEFNCLAMKIEKDKGDQ